MNDLGQETTRRSFLHNASLAGAGLWAAQAACRTGTDSGAKPGGEPPSSQFDCVVVGGTPGGIAAAVTAARMGRSVALVEDHAHLGGMSASGLGKSDIENRAAIRGFFAEFVERIHRHYLERYGPGLGKCPLVPGWILDTTTSPRWPKPPSTGWWKSSPPSAC